MVVMLQVRGNFCLTIANLSDEPVRRCLTNALQTGHIMMHASSTGNSKIHELPVSCSPKYLELLLDEGENSPRLSHEKKLFDLAKTVEWLYRDTDDHAFDDAPPVEHKSICGIVCGGYQLGQLEGVISSQFQK
jgi:hypothetical protein